MENRTYNKEYYDTIWNKILSKYSYDSPIYDLGDISRQYYIFYFVKTFLNSCKPQPSIRIVDFGAGNWLYLGELLRAVQEYCDALPYEMPIEIIGVDYNKKALNFGINKYKRNIPDNVTIKIINGNIIDIAKKFKVESCDLIISLETLEHLYEDVDFVTYASKLIKEDGVLVISTPNKRPFFLSKSWFIYVFFRKNFSEKDKKVGHLRRYSLHDFVNIAKQLEMKIVEYKCYGFFASDYMKELLSKLNGKKVFVSIFRICKRLLLIENYIFNTMKIKESEGIFVYIKRVDK